MLHQLPFQRLGKQYLARSASPVEVTRSALDHAERANPALNAFALIDREGALDGARRSEERWRRGAPLGPLDGMPIAIKEFAAVRGWPTRRGSAVTSDEPAAAHTVFVQRLADAGAVLLGKTRAPEFNWKGVTDSPAFGITRNPWNPALTPGGSSGGCAAAVAAGIVRVSMGSDAGGSIRIPAAFTGTIGLKPTHGRIPLSPLPSAFSNIVHTGPIAAGMDELEAAYLAARGASALDWTSCLGGDDGPDVPGGRPRIGLLSPRRWGPRCAAPVRAAMDEALAALRADGMDVVEIDVDIEAASRVGQDLYRLGCAAAVRAVAPELRGRLDPGLIAFVRGVDDWPISRYHALCQQRDQHANDLARLFGQVDLLMLPTVPLCAFEAGRDVPPDQPGDDWMSWNPYTPAFNSAQVPALSYPVWPQGEALPAGVQWVAPKYREDRLLALGRWLETRFPVRTAAEPE